MAARGAAAIARRPEARAGGRDRRDAALGTHRRARRRASRRQRSTCTKSCGKAGHDQLAHLRDDRRRLRRRSRARSRRGPQSALYGGTLWIRSIKLYADGAIGSRGAALLEPYSDDPGNTGLLISPPGASRRPSRRRRSAPASRCAPTRSATAATAWCSTPTRPRSPRCPWRDHRFRIEHAQILALRRHPALRAARRHPVDAGQPPVERHVLGRARASAFPGMVEAYAWRSLLNTGVVIPERQRLPGGARQPARSRSTRPSRGRTRTTSRRADGSPSR